jgi:hypothetical protein
MRKIVLDRVDTCVSLCAVDKRETNYVPVAKVAGTFSGGSELAEALGVGHQADYVAGAAVRASLCVGVNTGVPGPGYFEMAKQLGALKPNATDVERFLYFKAQRDLLGVPINAKAVAYGKSLGVVFCWCGCGKAVLSCSVV